MEEHGDTLIGALVVGNEILLGKTRDTNTIFLAENLLRRGLKLRRWGVVPDNERDISRELSRFMEDGYGIIVVSGGMGPTHDDITVRSIARGLGISLGFNEKCYRRMVEKWKRNNPGKKMPETARSGLDKMAYVPADFDLIENENGMVEGLVGVVNGGRSIVFILPGVPGEYRGIVTTRKFQDYLPRKDASSVTIIEIPFRGKESMIAACLGEVQKRFRDIDIGSYPQGPMNVVIRVTGDRENVMRAVDEIRDRLREAGFSD